MSTVIMQKTDAAQFRARTAIFMLLIIVFAPLGNVLLSKGMKPVLVPRGRDAALLLHVLLQVLTSPYIWLGICSLFIFVSAQMLALNWADYSYVQPATSASYLSLVVFSYLLLGERVSPLRFVGIVIICVGVIIVGRTNPRTTGVQLA